MLSTGAWQWLVNLKIVEIEVVSSSFLTEMTMYIVNPISDGQTRANRDEATHFAG